MLKILRIICLPPRAAFLTALAITGIHFSFSVLIGPYANQVFQVTFDTGKRPLGIDALIRVADLLLSLPIPSVLLAGHPSYGMLWPWWIATAINSAIWGLTIYCLFRFLIVLSKRQSHKTASTDSLVTDGEIR